MKHLRLITLTIGILISVASHARLYDVYERNGVTTAVSNNLVSTLYEVDDCMDLVGASTVEISNPDYVGTIKLKVISTQPLWQYMDIDEGEMLFELIMDNGINLNFIGLNPKAMSLDNKKVLKGGEECYETVITVRLTDSCEAKGLEIPSDPQARNEFLINYLQENKIKQFGIYADSTMPFTLGYYVHPMPLDTPGMFSAVFPEAKSSDFSYRRDLTVGDLLSRPMGCFTSREVPADELYETVCAHPEIFYVDATQGIKPELDITDDFYHWATVKSDIRPGKMYFMGYEIESVSADYPNNSRKTTVSESNFGITHQRTSQRFKDGFKKNKITMADMFAKAFEEEGFSMKKKKWADVKGYEGTKGNHRVVITYVNDDYSNIVSIRIEDTSLSHPTN